MKGIGFIALQFVVAAVASAELTFLPNTDSPMWIIFGDAPRRPQTIKPKPSPDFQVICVELPDPGMPPYILKITLGLSDKNITVKRFEFKEAYNDRTGEHLDISEVTLVNVLTGKKCLLVKNQLTEATNLR